VYWNVIRPKNIYLISFFNIIVQATVKMARAGQVVIPIEVREALGLKGGDLIVIDVLSKVEKASLQEQGKN
jgi:AbrB family looped-hinge helix DNA binding protein